MPHIRIEYSANIEEAVDMGSLCEALRAEAAAIDAFELPGVRVRAFRADHAAAADGNPAHGFVHLSVRLREGRTQEVKAAAIERVFGALRDFMAPAMADRPIALSAEIRDLEAATSPKSGNIREHLGGRHGRA